MGTPEPQYSPMGLHALITAYCAQRHVIGQWVDKIDKMHPIQCGQCNRSYPTWNGPISLATDVVTGFFTPTGAFVVAPPIETIPTDEQLGKG